MPWLNVAVYGGLIVATGIALLLISSLFGPRRYRSAKMAPYECGVEPVSETRERFSVKFYLIAILFILFDIETVFLIPWAVLYRQLGMAGLVEMFLFLGVLGFGLLYIWKRGALETE